VVTYEIKTLKLFQNNFISHVTMSLGPVCFLANYVTGAQTRF